MSMCNLFQEVGHGLKVAGEEIVKGVEAIVTDGEKLIRVVAGEGASCSSCAYERPPSRWHAWKSTVPLILAEAGKNHR